MYRGYTVLPNDCGQFAFRPGIFEVCLILSFDSNICMIQLRNWKLSNIQFDVLANNLNPNYLFFGYSNGVVFDTIM